MEQLHTNKDIVIVLAVEPNEKFHDKTFFSKRSQSTGIDGPQQNSTATMPRGTSEFLILKTVQISKHTAQYQDKYIYLDPPRGAKLMVIGAIKQPLRV